MIEAHELRLGNYISREDIGDVSIRFETVLELHQNKVVTSGPIKVVLDYGDLKPIELTEEILLKCGFEKKQDYIIGVGLCIFFEHKEFNYRLNQSFEVVLLKIKLNNLHQLQNLYFALTSKELEINL